MKKPGLKPIHDVEKAIIKRDGPQHDTSREVCGCT